MTIGEFLRQRRRELGLTQTELSFRTRIPQKNISLWETGTNTPNIRFLERLARELEVELPWFEDKVGAKRRSSRYGISPTSHAA